MRIDIITVVPELMESPFKASILKRAIDKGLAEVYFHNVRDYATINELTVLSNLETHNAQMIREGKPKEERFGVLQEIATYQLGVLNEAARIEAKEVLEIESEGED